MESRKLVYREEHRDALLTFRRKVYGSASFQASPQQLDWHLSQPGATAEQPGLWLWELGGEIVAQVAASQTTLRVGEREYPALWMSDFVVDPALRRQGLGSALTEDFKRLPFVRIALDVSRSAQSFSRKDGWSDLGVLRAYARPLDRAFLATKLGTSASRAAAKLLRALDATSSTMLRASRLELVEIAELDERSDRIWSEGRSRYPVVTSRDGAQLAWRFSRFPMRDRYRSFYLMARSRPIGYAVLRLEEQVGHVVDFLCEPRWTAYLLAASAARLRYEGAHVAVCSCGRAVPGRCFALAGFVPRPGEYHLQAELSPLAPEDRRIAVDARRWFVTEGDSNADRPREGTVYAPERVV